MNPHTTPTRIALIVATVVLAVAATIAAGCGGQKDPPLTEVEQVAKSELHVDHVRCTRNAPPHEFRCRYAVGVGPDSTVTATVKSKDGRVWVSDDGLSGDQLNSGG